jgi:aspartyl-tRNA(Asn)/glutamyl-tRNA(Gln) amidotransferase subunit A
MSTAARDPWTTAVHLRDAIQARQLSAREACLAALDRIGVADGPLHAFQLVDDERALARAEALDRSTDPPGLLHGVPIALKDNISVAGMRTTAGSRVLETYVPPFDATVVRKLEAAGAVIIGKTVCDEFAMGSSTENSAYGPSHNPWALDHTPGGSSGGSAVAVAAGLTPLALGSDTGGSIRQPAALCGIVGLKPTYGRVSRYGLIAFASSLDQIGPFARTVEDAALLLEVISGSEGRDSTASPAPVPAWRHAFPARAAGLTVGIPQHLLTTGVDRAVRRAFNDAVVVLETLGVKTVDIELPHSELGIPVYYVIATAEASSNLARYDGVRYGFRAEGDTLREMYERTRARGFGPEVKRRIMLGTYVLSAGYSEAFYLKAQQVRTLIRQDFERAFQTVDAVVLPTSPTPAFRLGERTADPLAMYRADVFTVGAPLAGLPALSVPCGLTETNLPMGVQFVGRAWDEATLFRLGDAFERATPWSAKHPNGY